MRRCKEIGQKLCRLGFLGFFLVSLLPGITAGAEENVVVFNSSGGALDEAQRKVFSNPFEKETGIKVIHTAPTNFAKLKAMVETGNVEWDITELPPRDMVRAVKLGYLEPIDYTVVKKADLLPEAALPYALGGGYYSTILAYNTNKFPKGKHPQSWAEFWDVKKFPGRRSLRNSPADTLEIALLADGVASDKLYPLDVDRAFKSLDRIKSHIAVWWTVGAQPAQLLTDKEVDLATSWNGRITDIQRKGAPVEIEWNQEILSLSYYGVVKGAKHKMNAMKYLAFRQRPDRQAEWIKTLPYPGASKSIFKYVTPELAKVLPTYPEHLKNAARVNFEWWLENADKVQERWNAWMLK
jgi:putative spermidine/putrescine transport system substrate-binding protein